MSFSTSSRARLSPRPWVIRSVGRRATDYRSRLEPVLYGAVVLAWSWCVFEVARLLIP
jgi:hypothetical protein